MKILNAYAGIGGNRKNWDGDRHDIVAVEINEEIAEVYRDHFPKDEVIIADAQEYLRGNYREFDYIWASPPCPSHSSIRKAGARNGQYKPKMPDMQLYEIILFLQGYFDGDYVVENVARTWYEPLVKPQKVSRHYFWSNYVVPEIEVEKQDIHEGNVSAWEEVLGFDLSDYRFESVEKRKVLRNCVHPEIGEAILKARNTKQVKITEVGDAGE